MGDRANIAFYETRKSQPIYFYTHWSGSELPTILRDALVRGRDRWGDEPYLARIIFCEMIQKDVMESTGYGISVTLGDGDNRILNVYADTKHVAVNDTTLELSFDDYIAFDATNFDKYIWG